MVFKLENHSDKWSHLHMHIVIFVDMLCRRISQHNYYKIHVIKDRFTIKASSLSIQRNSEGLHLIKSNCKKCKKNGQKTCWYNVSYNFYIS